MADGRAGTAARANAAHRSWGLPRIIRNRPLVWRHLRRGCSNWAGLWRTSEPSQARVSCHLRLCHHPSTQVEPPYVNAQRARDGRVRYWYFWRVGRRWRLQGEPMSPEFMAEYHRLLAATKPVAAPGPRERPAGSFGALADTYFGSPEVRSKRPSTQKMYRLVIEPLTEKAGSAP